MLHAVRASCRLLRFLSFQDVSHYLPPTSTSTMHLRRSGVKAVWIWQMLSSAYHVWVHMNYAWLRHVVWLHSHWSNELYFYRSGPGSLMRNHLKEYKSVKHKLMWTIFHLTFRICCRLTEWTTLDPLIIVWTLLLWYSHSSSTNSFF